MEKNSNIVKNDPWINPLMPEKKRMALVEFAAKTDKEQAKWLSPRAVAERSEKLRDELMAYNDDTNPAIAQIRRFIGENRTHALMCLIIDSFQEAMDPNKRASHFAIDSIAKDILREGYQLTFEQLGFVLNKLRTGEYGRSYQTMSSEFVMSGIRKFIKEKRQYKIDHNYSEHLTTKPGYREPEKDDGQPKSIAELQQAARENEERINLQSEIEKLKDQS